MTQTADWCEEFGENLVVCGTRMVERGRKSIGLRWCFTHRKREEFFRVIMVPVGLSYYGPSVRIEGPQGEWCRDLFPGWSREWDE